MPQTQYHRGDCARTRMMPTGKQIGSLSAVLEFARKYPLSSAVFPFRKHSVHSYISLHSSSILYMELRGAAMSRRSIGSKVVSGSTSPAGSKAGLS